LEQVELTKQIAQNFSSFLISVSEDKSTTFQYYHYVVARAVYEGFITYFPSSRAQFAPSCKKEILLQIIEFFIGIEFLKKMSNK
jgi:hypothetical protein